MESQAAGYAVDSQAVQAHLGLMQGIIQRMASNSSSCKTWCVTLVSAILVAVADRNKAEYAVIAAIPILLFFALDTYYLSLEKEFRNSYNEFIGKLHSGTLVATDLYAITATGSPFRAAVASMQSPSVWPFYVALLVLAALTKWFLQAG
jgi:hypothetical protein